VLVLPDELPHSAKKKTANEKKKSFFIVIFLIEMQIASRGHLPDYFLEQPQLSFEWRIFY